MIKQISTAISCLTKVNNNKILTIENISKSVKLAEYAVRGLVPIEAVRIKRALVKNNFFDFIR